MEFWLEANMRFWFCKKQIKFKTVQDTAQYYIFVRWEKKSYAFTNSIFGRKQIIQLQKPEKAWKTTTIKFPKISWK